MKFSYSFWQWLIGQSWTAAEIYVNRAVKEAERQVQSALERVNKKAVTEFRGFIANLENWLEDLLSERKKEIDLVVKKRDMGER